LDGCCGSRAGQITKTESLALNDNSNLTGGDDQQQTAAYIFDMLIGLSSAARQTDLTFLAYLLEMAGSEASRVSEGKAPSAAQDVPASKRAAR
jgi:hypothetical protein